MKTWNQLFIRHGWLLVEEAENQFNCEFETENNLQFLFECLGRAEIPYVYHQRVLTLLENAIEEESWIESIDYPSRGRGEGLWFQPGLADPKVQELDLYISGVVRQLNRLGFYTTGSCDGHDRRAPYVMLTKECQIEMLNDVFLALDIRRVHWREHRNYYLFKFSQSKNGLLDVAEKMSQIDESWLGNDVDLLKEQLFCKLVEELLMIPGESGNEYKVRQFTIDKLSPLVDYLTIDHAGNVLAEKTYRGGNGPTILLNAHLDIVCELEKNRKIVKNGPIWSSSKGILGADDRAGIAIILWVMEQLLHSPFSGKVKAIFTVEEENGLVGARQVDDYFLWGTDAAVVVDRRGSGDIVTSCGGYISFCHPEYGAFFEKVAYREGLSSWATTAGGSSDTRIWAEHGIQSVNLSAGYRNEHTDDEQLDVFACYQTVKLLNGIFKTGNELRSLVRKIKRKQPASRQWKKAQ